jgi:hypothetical protein
MMRQVLAGRADQRDADLLAQLLLHLVLDVDREAAPVLGGVPKLHRVVVDVEVDRLLRGAEKRSAS